MLALPPVAEALEAVLGAEGQPSPGAGDLLLSGALAVAVLIVVLARPRTLTRLDRTPLAGWAGLRLLLTPVPALALGRAAARLDVVRAAAAVRSASNRVLTAW